MTQMVSRFEELINKLRHTLPENSSLAQAIDQHEPRDRIAMKAIDDGYIETPDEFVQFAEVCARNCTT